VPLAGVVSPVTDATTAPLLAALGVVAVAVAALRAWEVQRAGTVLHRLAGPTSPPVPPAWFGRVLHLSGLGVEPGPAWRWSVRAVVSVAALVAWHRPVLVTVLALGAAAAMLGRRRFRVRADHRDEPHHLAAVIDVVLFRLAAGTSLAAALEAAAVDPTPLAPDLARVAGRIRHGLGVQAAVDEWAATSGSPGVRLLADAVAIAGVSGGSQQAALLGVQATLRERDALAREIRALAAQARTSGVVLVITPVAFAVFVAVVDPRVAAFFASPAGWGCVAAGLVLDAVGATWMDRMAGAVE
jgi:tight adherence protein B